MSENSVDARESLAGQLSYFAWSYSLKFSETGETICAHEWDDETGLIKVYRTMQTPEGYDGIRRGDSLAMLLQLRQQVVEVLGERAPLAEGAIDLLDKMRESLININLPEREIQNLSKMLETVAEQVCEGVGSEVGQRTEETAAVQGKGKSPGRKKPDYETVERESNLKKEWLRAHDSGTCKADFAKGKGLSQKDFTRLLDRVSRRNRRSDN